MGCVNCLEPLEYSDFHYRITDTLVTVYIFKNMEIYNQYIHSQVKDKSLIMDILTINPKSQMTGKDAFKKIAGRLKFRLLTSYNNPIYSIIDFID